MSREPDEFDIAFDSILNIEHESYENGRKRGIDVGLKQALLLAEHDATKQGSTLGKELGYYTGCTAVLAAMVHPDFQIETSKKACLAIPRLQKSLDAAIEVLHSPQEHVDTAAQKIQLVRAKLLSCISVFELEMKLPPRSYFTGDEDAEQKDTTASPCQSLNF